MKTREITKLTIRLGIMSLKIIAGKTLSEEERKTYGRELYESLNTLYDLDKMNGLRPASLVESSYLKDRIGEAAPPYYLYIQSLELHPVDILKGIEENKPWASLVEPTLRKMRVQETKYDKLHIGTFALILDGALWDAVSEVSERHNAAVLPNGFLRCFDSSLEPPEGTIKDTIINYMKIGGR